MNIEALSMSLAQNRLMENVGIAMLAKTLDTGESMGSELVAAIDEQMRSAMELSVNPNIGSNIDISL